MAGIPWRGRRACQCVIDATADYEILTKGSLVGRIFQACYSFAAASAGTHGKGGALDTIQLSADQIKAASSIGFWPSNRFPYQGFDPHCHWVLFGCPHMAEGLRYQESEMRAGRDGLRGRRKDIHRGLRPRLILTYRQWKLSQTPLVEGTLLIGGKVYKDVDPIEVSKINAARGRKSVSVEAWYVQSWLRKLGFYRSIVDGQWGPVSQAALNSFRRSLGWPESDCIGDIGWSSLTRLHIKAGSSKHISQL